MGRAYRRGAACVELRHAGRRLLAGLRARPDDAELHLVYSDWLEEVGDAAHAEFVRLMLRLADAARATGVHELATITPGYPPTGPRRQDHAAAWADYDRASATLAAHWRRWLPRGSFGWWRQNGIRPWLEGRWCRGLLVAASWPLAGWLRCGPAILRNNPVRHVHIRGHRPRHHGWIAWLGDPLRRPRLACGADTPASPCELPKELFWRLGGCFATLDGWGVCLFKSDNQAHSALSTACLNFALGLPTPPRPGFVVPRLANLRFQDLVQVESWDRNPIQLAHGDATVPNYGLEAVRAELALCGDAGGRRPAALADAAAAAADALALAQYSRLAAAARGAP